jgi:hypothetical protein
MELAVGDAQDAVAGALEAAIAGAVLLEGCSRGVRRVAVELDDEPGMRPVEVRTHEIAPGPHQPCAPLTRARRVG